MIKGTPLSKEDSMRGPAASLVPQAKLHAQAKLQAKLSQLLHLLLGCHQHRADSQGSAHRLHPKLYLPSAQEPCASPWETWADVGEVLDSG